MEADNAVAVAGPDSAAGADSVGEAGSVTGAGVPATAGSVLIGRSVAAAVAGLLAAVAAVLLVRNGIRTDTFPPFLEGAPSTTITRYSGPWLTAGAGAALLAALLLCSAVIDLRRWLRGRPAGGTRDDLARPARDVTGATSS